MDSRTLDSMVIIARAKLDFVVFQSDDTSVSATFTARYENTIISKTVPFNDEGEAHFSFGDPDTSVPGKYQYQIAENYAEGSPDIYPTNESCDAGEAEMPTLEILTNIAEPTEV